MTTCTACGGGTPEGSRFCPSCAAPLGFAENGSSKTELPTRDSPATPSLAPRQLGGRFLPGTMIDRRYRIVGLLGRGGMGEVYRADDVKLRQSVALKFLSVEMERDETWLDRFLNEVRTARQVTHPNVCRVYDVGDVDGRHFLSMEYVDGEDLASLLRRIGRLPEEKATQIARQLCAGLAASHEEGILHRDLKPSNIMIDGKGRVRIADFGLARWAETVQGVDAMAGTPAYMAPEQIAGGKVTTRTDIYALGLVLYELFTGTSAFRAKTLPEIRRLQEDSTPPSMGSLVDNLDPAVESVVLRCLEKDPVQRPASALAVATALPGGESLAAAIAAGETPSPEMVAAAGTTGSISIRTGVLYLVSIAVGLALLFVLRAPVSPDRVMPLELSPPVLENRAVEILRTLGHTGAAEDSAYGYIWNTGYLQQIAGTQADKWAQDGGHESPAPVHFWFRDSPADMVPWQRSLLGQFAGRISPIDPPMTEPGMRSVTVGPRGRLISLAVLGVPTPDAASAEPFDWTEAFVVAGLDPSAFREVAPAHLPPVPSDRRRAWTGFYPDEPDWPLRIEAASLAGMPIWFEQFGPWDPADQEALVEHRAELRRSTRLSSNVGAGVFVGGFGLLVWLAWRNVRSSRWDRAGATRIIPFLLGANLVFWLFHSDHAGHWGSDGFAFMGAVSWALSRALFACVIFLALEPYIRRYWPDRMISWSRLLSGRWRDPLVGRDVLAGSLAALVAGLLISVAFWASGWPVLTNPHPALADMLLSPRYAVAHMVGNLNGALGNSLFLLAFFVLCRVLFRVRWLATSIWVLLVTTIVWFAVSPQAVVLPIGLSLALTMAFVIHRFGLLAYIVTAFWFYAQAGAPLTTDPDVWYASSTLTVMGAYAATVLVSFHVATRGRSPGSPQS